MKEAGDFDKVTFPPNSTLKYIFTPVPPEKLTQIRAKEEKEAVKLKEEVKLAEAQGIQEASPLSPKHKDGSAKSARKTTGDQYNMMKDDFKNKKGLPPKAPTHNSMTTPVGELIYSRAVLDFTNKKKVTSRDTVCEENLLDVKKLLKTSSFAGATSGETGVDGQKKTLVKVNVEPFYKR